MTTVFNKPQDLIDAVGQSLGQTEWLKIEQDRISQFADATGDHQWIHVDPDKAKNGPFGTCIAHGYLTLSLVNYFLPQLIEVQGIKMGVNVGLNKVRFPNAVKVGAKICGAGEIVGVEEIKGAIQVVVRVTVEIEGEDRPGCVAETISRFYPED